MSHGLNVLSNSMRQQARAAMAEIALPEHASISSYDMSSHSVKVTVQADPEAEVIESNWMPLGAIGIGAGWGVAVGPQIGDQVLVVFEHGDYSSGSIVGRYFSTSQPAIPVPPGEIWAVHQSGSFLKLVTSGDMDINSAGNANITVTGNAAITAKICSIAASVSAAITAPAITLGASGQSLLGFVTSAFVSLFNGHSHISEAPGSPTSAPQQLMGAGQITSTVTGG